MFAWLIGAIALGVLLWVLLHHKIGRLGSGLGLDGIRLSLGARVPRSGRGFNGGGGHHQPRDPFSEVRHPNARRPGGNSAAVAVEEPEEEKSLTLVGAAK
ncbi:MAG TPA: hypothetical protein VKB50_19230 [Vicinamibacterales bacterium]|nr:hypothetical protein [Vicinamibacterales bacterium]